MVPTMNLQRRNIHFTARVLAPLALGALVFAQGNQAGPRPQPSTASTDTTWGLAPATLLNPPADSWPTYHGDYTGQRHSRLTQITPDNVHQLTLAWTFQTGQNSGIK